MDIHRARFVDYSPHTITAMAFSHGSDTDVPAPINLRLAIGRSNGDIELWNPRYGWTHELTVYGARGRSIEGLCWSQEGSDAPRLFSIGGSTVVTEWDLATQKPLANYDCNAGVIWSIDASKSGEQLAVGCDDGSVVIIDISGGPGSLEHSLICQRQESRVLSVCWFSEDLVIGGCADARVRCWSVSNNGANGEGRGRLISTMRVDKSKTESTLVWSVQVLPSLNQIVSGDSTGSIKFWDINHFTLLQSFKVHDADVLCIVPDSKNKKIFSAGVDRKIHQFQMITSTSNKISKWVHSNSRLLHSNDVRTMATFEGKGANFLVSGGVEKSIVISSVSNFHDGKYRKLAITQQKPNVTISEREGLVAMWQDQTVKIWKVLNENDSQQPYKLVSKLSLSNEENITSVSINNEGTLLAVSTLGSVKLFRITSNNANKLSINKIRDPNFDQLIEGSKQALLFNNNSILILTTDNEIYRFQILDDEDKVELVNEIETVDTPALSASTLPYKQNIFNLTISKDNQLLAISRLNGSIEVLPLDEENSFEAYVLTKLSVCPSNMIFSNDNTLIVITEENKIYEFNVKHSTPITKSKKKNANASSSLLTQWSKRNSEFLPKQFLTLEDKPQGIFLDNQTSSKRIWIYGSNWLVFFDLSKNIPISKAYQNTTTSKKRDADGLQVQDAGVAEENESQVNGNANIIDSSNVDALELSLKQSQINRLREQIQSDEQQNSPENTSAKPFWMTTKYRPILSVGPFGDGIIVVELPSLVSATPAFNLPKFRV